MAAAPGNAAPPPPPRMEAQAFRWEPAPGSRLPDCSGPLCTRLTARGGGFKVIEARAQETGHAGEAEV